MSSLLSQKPHIQAIQKELTKIGGTVESGEYAGQPKIKIVHGSEETYFLLGRERPRFARLQKCEYIWKRWFISPELQTELRSWVEEEFPKHQNPAQPLRLARFFETARALEYIELTDSDNPTSDTIAPQGWLYVADLNEVRDAIYPYWFVLQYVASDQLNDTESSWNSQRWDIKYVPEVRTTVLVDYLGPFPKDGLYFIQLLECYKTDENGVETEIEPTFETVVEPVRRMIQERDRQTIHERGAEQRVQNFFQKMDDARNREKDQTWKKYDEVAASMHPAFVKADAFVTVKENTFKKEEK